MIENFHFLRPLWLLTLLPLAWLLWRHWHRQLRGGVWQGVCDAHLLEHLLVGAQQRGARTPAVLLGAAGLLAVIALAGPAWSKLPQPVYRNSAATVVLLNLSETMNAADVTPTRLERAKLKLLDFLRRQREGQTALVAYAGEAYLVSPLTDDAATIASLVAPLKTDLMPVSGNQLSDALQKADALLDQSGVYKGGRLLLITDSAGDGGALKIINRLREKARVLSVLAVGTGQGAPIAAADGGFVKDSSGAIVIPTLNRAELEHLANAGQGNFVTLTTDDDDLNRLWSGQQVELEAPQDRGEDHVADVWREEGPWLLLLALPLAALVWRRGWLMVVVLTILGQPQSAQAFTWQDLWARPDQQAYRVLQNGDAKAAADMFKDQNWKDVAHYRAGDYDRAAAGFGKQQQPDAYYNQGNALAHAGKLEEAAQAYRQALQQQPGHADAQHNLKIVEDLLKKQQQENTSERNDNQDDKQQEQQSQQQSDQDESSKQQQQDKDSGGNSDQDQKQIPEHAGQQEQNAKDAEQQQGKQADKQESAQQDRDAQPAEQAAADKESHDAAQDKQQQTASTGDEKDVERKNAAAVDDTQAEKTETAQALEQWLRRIPDDPGGLLRRKFMLQHQQRSRTDDDEGS